MDMTSHLLAALNLPPIRDVPPYSSGTDLPQPLEPSASQDAYSSSQYQQGRRDPQQLPAQADMQNDMSMDSFPLQLPSPPRQNVHDDMKEAMAAHVARRRLKIRQDEPGSSFGRRSYPPILPSITPMSEEQESQRRRSSRSQSTAVNTSGNRRVRRKWTEEETNDLIQGCSIHGVGNWKKVLDDPRFHFNGRSSVDLKDRFRTCFPKEYRKPVDNESESEDSPPPKPRPAPPGDTIVVTPLPIRPPKPPKLPKLSSTPKTYGEKKRKTTKTELHHAEVLEKLGIEGSFPKVQRRQRREFTADEDARLLQGFTLYGASWSKIQNDPTLYLSHRRSTDLRDRFRNAFPDRYESAGFKARPRQRARNVNLENSDSITVRSGRNLDEGENYELDDDNGDCDMNGSGRGDSTALLMQSLLGGHLSPSWGHQEGQMTSSDQSPAPGSLALDPALHEGFEGSTLEQITEDFLSVAQGNGKQEQHEDDGSLVRWEDMATHPIFDLEGSITGTSTPMVQQTGHPENNMAQNETRKRFAEEFADEETSTFLKKSRSLDASEHTSNHEISMSDVSISEVPMADLAVPGNVPGGSIAEA